MGKGFATRAVHGGVAPRTVQQPASVPIYQTSTWRFSSSEEFAEVLANARPGHAYGRGYGNPTVEAFETVMADLEETEAAFGFSSGASAIFATCLMLARRQGERPSRIVASRQLYGGTYSLFVEVMPTLGVEVDLVDASDLDAVADLLDGASAFYCETIANPLCRVLDLPTLAKMCRERGVPTVVDSTFASPWLCVPSSFGFDFVVHSVTKFIAGHSDVIGGVVCCSAEDRRRIRHLAIEVGGAMQPFDAWLTVRGLESLDVRIRRQCSNALLLAETLAGDPRIAQVHYPGLAGHADHETARRLFRQDAFGGVLSVELRGGVDEAVRWCDSLQTAWIGASLGGAHTLVCHPASTTHRQVAPDSRRELGLADGLVRISAGLEDGEDLVEDFVQALKAI